MQTHMSLFNVAWSVRYDGGKYVPRYLITLTLTFDRQPFLSTSG